jgi:hypothetical protein
MAQVASQQESIADNTSFFEPPFGKRDQKQQDAWLAEMIKLSGEQRTVT